MDNPLQNGNNIHDTVKIVTKNCTGVNNVWNKAKKMSFLHCSDLVFPDLGAISNALDVRIDNCRRVVSISPFSLCHTIELIETPVTDLSQDTHIHTYVFLRVCVHPSLQNVVNLTIKKCDSVTTVPSLGQRSCLLGLNCVCVALTKHYTSFNR